MIKTYKYLDSVHGKLHEFVIAFFNRIEFETGDFDDAFFDPEFLVIVKRHPKVLRQRCKEIYNAIRGWDQNDRSTLCKQIRESNEIENICKGNYKPPVIDQNNTGVMGLLRELFMALYNQVLDGKGFRDKYQTKLRDHFDAFSRLNIEITRCPICGIADLKKHHDETRDQYDHYLPKALYPFSSINFRNLVPSCKECNSFDAKGAKDTIAISTGRIFFPYDQAHKGIVVEVNVSKDDEKIENIEWKIKYISPDNKKDEVQSWINIYKIKERHLGYIKGRIIKWYQLFFNFVNSKSMEGKPPEDRKEVYLSWLKERENLEINDFMERPALEGFLNDSTLAQAAIEMKLYS